MIDLVDIQSAAKRIAAQAIKTPCLNSSFVDGLVEANVFFKCEPFQIGGSFKFRGAYNLLLQLTEEQRRQGGVATSSGNHAQGFAAAAKMLGMQAVIAMPFDSPEFKLQNTKNFGAEVIHYDRIKDDERVIRETLARERKLVEVPPFDHPHIIAGQGTVGLEFYEQTAEVGKQLDVLLIPCGGGGLAAGCTIAFSALSPTTQIVIVEPKGFEDTTRSLLSGEIEQNDPAAQSICDALLLPFPGRLTFPILQSAQVEGMVVSDDEVRRAISLAATRLKTVVEPGGAVALAALLSGRHDFRGKNIGVVLSGGNIGAELLAECIKNY